MSPVGPYFPSGLQPISLYLDERNVRAWPGGVGNNKVGTNYAPTIGPQMDASEQHGTSQVLYSFPQGSDPDDALVSECGSMNLMFLLQKVWYAGRLGILGDGVAALLRLACMLVSVQQSPNCRSAQCEYLRCLRISKCNNARANKTGLASSACS